jgi:pimeloyl-ACP methyl ester carboxylesterase
MTAPVVVLVPGSFHGSWCFAQIVKELENLGIRAIAVDLPSVGGRSDEPGDLHGDASHLRSVLDQIDTPVVLMGHSRGGAVITEAGVHPSVGHLVYLAALVPSDGETCGQLLGIEGMSEIDDHPVMAGTPQEAIGRFYHDCDEHTATWAVAQLGPEPLGWLRQEPLAVAWRERPSTYVVCSDDRAIPAGLQRAWAIRCTTSIEWESGHSPFLSHPSWVVDLLATTAASL